MEKDFSEWTKEKEEEIFEAMLCLAKEQIQLGPHGMIGTIVIDDEGEIATRWLTSTKEIVRSVFDGYMNVVATIPGGGITDWYGEEGVPHAGDLTDEERKDIRDSAGKKT